MPPANRSVNVCFKLNLSFVGCPCRAGVGRSSPYTAEPGSSFFPATNGKLPAEPGTTWNPYIRFR